MAIKCVLYPWGTHEEHDVNLPPPNTLITSIQCNFLCLRFIVLQLQYILAIKCNLASHNVLVQVINTLNDLLHDMAINARIVFSQFHFKVMNWNYWNFTFQWPWKLKLIAVCRGMSYVLCSLYRHVHNRWALSTITAEPFLKNPNPNPNPRDFDTSRPIAPDRKCSLCIG